MAPTGERGEDKGWNQKKLKRERQAEKDGQIDRQQSFRSRLFTIMAEVMGIKVTSSPWWRRKRSFQ